MNDLNELPPPPVQYETAGELPNRVLTQRTNGEITLMMTEIGPCTFVGWDRCTRCSSHIRDCTCPGGPVEREIISRWRQERLASTRSSSPVTFSEPDAPRGTEADRQDDGLMPPGIREPLATGLDAAAEAVEEHRAQQERDLSRFDVDF